MAQTPTALWLRVLKVFWATLLISLLAFSVLMAAWGDLREAVMLRFVDDRYVKSMLLQLPAGTLVSIGDEGLGPAAPHTLAPDDGAESAETVEGMPITMPRVYLREDQILEFGKRWQPGEPLAALIARLAPNATLLWHAGDAQASGFTPVLLGREGRIDYALLATFTLPGTEPVDAAFLLRAEHEGKRVFSIQRQELWTDQMWVPSGEFWARREQYDSLPPHSLGQTKTVWRWYFAFEQDEAAWRKAHVPHELSEAAWTALPLKE